MVPLDMVHFTRYVIARATTFSSRSSPALDLVFDYGQLPVVAVAANAVGRGGDFRAGI